MSDLMVKVSRQQLEYWRTMPLNGLPETVASMIETVLTAPMEGHQEPTAERLLMVKVLSAEDCEPIAKHICGRDVRCDPSKRYRVSISDLGDSESTRESAHDASQI